MSEQWVPRKRRGAELYLIVLALVLSIGSYVAVGLGVNGEIPANTYVLAGFMTFIAIGAHLVVRHIAPYADPLLLPLVLCLNGIGLAMIHRIDLAYLAQRDTWRPLANTQMIWTVIGAGLFVGLLFVVRDHRRLQAYTYTAGLAAIALLIMPLLPVIGQNIRGARIWINVFGFSFQPGEAAKVLLAIFFAGYLVVKRDALALAGKRVLGIDLPRGRDLGSSLLFFGLFVVMLYVATERPGWLVVGAGLFGVGAYFGYLAFTHVQRRFDAWLDPFSDPDANYQVISSLFGLAHGGIIGRGWGLGSPELTPFGYSDFIAASLGEELGLAGLMAVLLIYGIIVERGLRIALTCRDGFGKLLAIGLTMSFAIQVFIVIGGVTRLIPLTGLTTPFLAQGGSSVVMNWVIIALLLRISDQTRRPAPEVQAFTSDDDTQVVKLP